MFTASRRAVELEPSTLDDLKALRWDDVESRSD
jgi:hypothetical protein